MRIVHDLTELGYKVIIVPEAATELIISGVNPKEQYYDELDFQNIILNYQLKREDAYEFSAKKMKHKKIVIIYDRGVMDNKAYMSESQFSKLLKLNNLTEFDLKNRYDGIFDLRSASRGAEKFYTTTNNLARDESIEEARLLDDKIIYCWTGHPYLRIIDNSTNFEEKIDRLMAEIFRFIGLPVPVRIQKKFLITMPNLAKMLESFKYEKTQIIQTYLLSDDPNTELRIRQSGFDGSYSYSFTSQSQLEVSSNVATTVTIGKRITEKEYLSNCMKANTDLHQIKKDRYSFVFNNVYYELDVYPFWNENAILEIKLTEENQKVEIPSNIHVLKDVTNDVNFRNYAMAKNIPNVA